MNAEFLAQLTVKELQALAREHAIAGRSKMRKSELITQLLATAAAVPPAETKPVPLPVEAPPAASSPAKQAVDDGAQFDTDPGLPIPEHYGHDRLVLLPQDPNHVFAYWELSGDALDHARRELGELGTPTLLIHHETGCEERAIDLTGGNYYLTVEADTSYRAELALRGSNGALVCVIASDPIRTPASGPSERTDETWMAVDEHFDELLVRAGLPGAAGSSAELSEAMTRRTRLWQETTVQPFSSGALGRIDIDQGVGGMSSGLTSSWSSHNLVRH